MRYMISMMIAMFSISVIDRSAVAFDVDTVSGLQSFIENVVLSRLPDPVGDVVNVVRSAPEITKKGTLLWLNRKMVNAASRGDFELVDRYQAFFSCLATDDCEALRRLQIATTSVSGYLGCYKDQGDPTGTRGRDLNGFVFNDRNMTTGRCVSECRARGFAYAGTQYGSWCFCGNSYGKSGHANNCNMACSGNSGEICGGPWANSIYELR